MGAALEAIRSSVKALEDFGQTGARLGGRKDGEQPEAGVAESKSEASQ